MKVAIFTKAIYRFMAIPCKDSNTISGQFSTTYGKTKTKTKTIQWNKDSIFKNGGRVTGYLHRRMDIGPYLLPYRNSSASGSST